jgi:hypothetical protein
MRYLFLISLIASICGFVFAAVDTDFTMNSAVLQEKKNGVEIWKKPDGTIITVYADRSEAKNPDGSRIVKYSDGRRESYFVDGTKVNVDESKGVREYEKDGKKSKIDFTGMTPFGEKISPVEKIILKEPLVRILYLPEKSDEILYPEKFEEKVDWEIKEFFDTIFNNLRLKYGSEVQKKNPYKGNPYDILISYCRYCKTGYCYGKQKSVTVEFVEKGKSIKIFVFESINLRNKAKLQEYIKTVVDFAIER